MHIPMRHQFLCHDARRGPPGAAGQDRDRAPRRASGEPLRDRASAVRGVLPAWPHRGAGGRAAAPPGGADRGLRGRGWGGGRGAGGAGGGCGARDGAALAAARRLRELGYTDVSLLAGGLAGWTADGGELFEDVNAPSKAFGELGAETAGRPSLAADEVAALLRPAAGA